MGIMQYVTRTDGTTKEVYQTIVSDYNTFPFQWRTFDVDACLKNGTSTLITFNVKVDNGTEVIQRMSSFETGMRNAISTLIHTTPLRLVRQMKDTAVGLNYDVVDIANFLDGYPHSQG